MPLKWIKSGKDPLRKNYIVVKMNFDVYFYVLGFKFWGGGGGLF